VSDTITFGDLKTQTQADLFPTGVPYNLRNAYARLFQEALYDIQQKVDCFQHNNTQIVPFCNTKFQCGFTVFTAPKGRIWRVSVVDQVIPETGKENKDADIQWCGEVVYKQVDYCQLEKFVDRVLGCACSSFPWPPSPWPYTSKTPSPQLTRFPVPDQSAFAAYPEMPLGFLYPDASTDSPTGRAKVGVWALHSGRIYVAPWIQSTETVLIEWDGIKTQWSDDDLVEDNPQLKAAIKQFLQSQRSLYYDCDQGQMLQFAAAYQDTRSWLLRECNEQNRVKDCGPRKSRWSGLTIEEQVLTTTTTSTTTCPSGWVLRTDRFVDLLRLACVHSRPRHVSDGPLDGAVVSPTSMRGALLLGGPVGGAPGNSGRGDPRCLARFRRLHQRRRCWPRLRRSSAPDRRLLPREPSLH
jgi:hypothetical protein